MLKRKGLSLPVVPESTVYSERYLEQQQERSELEKQINAIQISLEILASSVHRMEQRLEKQQKQQNQKIVDIVTTVQQDLFEKYSTVISQLQRNIDQMMLQNGPELTQETRRVEPSKTKKGEPISMEEASAILKDNLL